MADNGSQPSLDTLEQYLDKPPYYGKSAHQDNVAVRQLCGHTAKFDHKRKMWGTSCEDALRNLISSQKWKPIGIERAWYASLMRAAQAHRTKAEAQWLAQQEAEANAAKEVGTQKRATMWLGGAAARPSAKAKVAPAAPAAPAATAPAPAPAPASASWRKRPEEKKRVRDGLLPTSMEASECARMGFTEAAIAHLKRLDDLGPRGSLSDEGRLLRYFSLVFEHDEPVPELTREERRASWNYECRWPLPDTADSRKYVEDLNRNAAAAAAAEAAAAEAAR